MEFANVWIAAAGEGGRVESTGSISRHWAHPLVIVNDNPAAPKIGMALLRCEACFTRDISILPDKRGEAIRFNR